MRKPARDLRPGDRYRAADGVEHEVKACWTSGIRTYVVHADEEERILFPGLLVEVL